MSEATPYLVDARYMEPPEPFERTLEMLETLPPEAEMCLLLYREPHPLYRVLERNGHAWRTVLRDDGTFEIYIRQRER